MLLYSGGSDRNIFDIINQFNSIIFRCWIPLGINNGSSFSSSAVSQFRALACLFYYISYAKLFLSTDIIMDICHFLKCNRERRFSSLYSKQFYSCPNLRTSFSLVILIVESLVFLCSTTFRRAPISLWYELWGPPFRT